MRKDRLRDRSILICSAFLFLCLFNYVYITIVTKRWAYLGFTFEPPPIPSILLALLLGLLPIIWMPIRLTRPSQVLYWMLYAFVYVPSLFLPHYLQRQLPRDLCLLNISFFLSFFILSLAYKIPLKAITPPKLSKNKWWFFVIVTGSFLYLAVIAVYGGRLQLAGLYNRELRLASRDLSTTFLTGYGQIWLANVINPMLMAIGLYRKKPLPFFIGAIGQVFLFMTIAMKGWLLSIFLLPLMFLVLRSKKKILGSRFILGMSGLLMITILLQFYQLPYSFIIQDLTGFRLFSDPGFMTSVYSDYFSQNPWTYWSHLKGIRALVEYPYDLPINYLIGDYLGNRMNSANAHAWATDGIAAMGLAGVLVVGFLLAIIFYILDCSAAGFNPIFSGLSITMHGIALSNLSLMSSFLGGGILFNIILFWMMPRYIINHEPKLRHVLRNSMPGAPIHICIITSAHPVDDVRVNHKLGQAFRANGFRVTWVGPNHAFFDPNSYDKYGIQYKLFSPGKGKAGRILNNIKLFWRALHISNVDVFYVPDPDAAAFAVRLLRRPKTRIIFDIHEMFHGVMLDRWVKGGLTKAVSKILLRQLLNVCSNCDLVIGVSQAVLAPYKDVIKEKIEVRSCAPSWFAKDPPSDVCGINRNGFTFYHGKANPSQGTGVVLKALELTKNLFPNIKCIMFDSFAGAADELAAFEQQVAELSLINSVELRQGIPMHQMPMVLRECDAGLIAYGRELGIDSLPNKLFEYMAAGLPIIAPKYSPEIFRIIESERCGIAVDFEDPISVADAMVWFCQNPNEAREMGRRARIAFEERNNWESEVQPLINRIQSWFMKE